MRQFSTLASICLWASMFSMSFAHASVLSDPLSPSKAEPSLMDDALRIQNAEYIATVEFETSEVELASSSRVTYTVAPGDTLGKIAGKYNISVASIRRSNRLQGDQIFVGQKLRLRSRSAVGSQERIVHTVRSGDTGGGIAQKYRVPISELRRWNPSANLDRITIGQKLVVYTSLGDGAAIGGRAGPVASGLPNRGRLAGGVQLEDAAGLQVRNVRRAYGMPVMVDAIKMAYGRMNAHFAEHTAVRVGDLSLPNGGRMKPHTSHQNGLDADIAYMTQECLNSLCKMIDVRADDVDVPRQWYVFEDWLRADIVEFIFVPYAFQKRFYEYAKSRGVSSEELAQWFQYPRGKNARTGILRDWRGHGNHYHVRFKDKD